MIYKNSLQSTGPWKGRNSKRCLLKCRPLQQLVPGRVELGTSHLPSPQTHTSPRSSLAKLFQAHSWQLLRSPQKPRAQKSLKQPPVSSLQALYRPGRDWCTILTGRVFFLLEKYGKYSYEVTVCQLIILNNANKIRRVSSHPAQQLLKHISKVYQNFAEFSVNEVLFSLSPPSRNGSKKKQNKTKNP